MKRILLLLGVVLLAFTAGRLSISPSSVSIERSPSPGWIEVYREGELDSEWRAEDGEVFQILDRLLRDAPELYQGKPVRKPLQEGRLT